MNSRLTGDVRHICRFCIAAYGLDFKRDVGTLMRTLDEFAEHQAMMHPRKEGENARQSDG